MDQTQPTTPFLSGLARSDASPPNGEIFKPIDPNLSFQERLEAQDEWIETCDGARFELARPVYKPEVIAHALGMSVRFTGHVREFYSIAEHCVLVAMLMERYYGGDPFEGLMHDGTEFVLADISSPVKRLLPDYKAVENHFDEALRRQFGLPLKKTAECKRADRVALFIEAHYLIPSGGAHYQDPFGERDEAKRLIAATGLRIACLEPAPARALWLAVFNKMQAGKAPRIILA